MESGDATKVVQYGLVKIAATNLQTLSLKMIMYFGFVMSAVHISIIKKVLTDTHKSIFVRVVAMKMTQPLIISRVLVPIAVNLYLTRMQHCVWIVSRLAGKKQNNG